MTLNIRFPFKTQAQKKRASEKQIIDRKLQTLDTDKTILWDEFHKLLKHGSEEILINETMTLYHLSNLVMQRLQSGAITAYQAPNGTELSLTDALNRRLREVPRQNIFKNPCYFIDGIGGRGAPMPSPHESCVQPQGLYFKAGDIAQAIKDSELPATILNPRTLFNSTGSNDLYTPAVDALEKCANVDITFTPFDFDACLQEALDLVQTPTTYELYP